MRFAVAYWIRAESPESPYCEMLYRSVESLRRHASDLPVVVFADLPPPRIDGFGVQYVNTPCRQKVGLELNASIGKYRLWQQQLLRVYDAVLYVDADTFFNRSPARLFRRLMNFAFAARPETGMTASSLQRANRFLRRRGLPRLLHNVRWDGRVFFNTGAYLFQPRRVGELFGKLEAALRKDFQLPFRPGSAGTWWNKIRRAMIEEIAVAEALRVSQLEPVHLSALDHGFYWEDEPLGKAVVLHTGSGFYEDCLRAHFGAPT